MNLIKVAAVAFMFIGVQSSVLYAQDEEPKAKKEKKAKKDDGKIHKSGKKGEVAKYRRSSLHTMIIEDAKLPKIDLILKTFSAAPVPDKYNDHTVEDN